MNITRVLGWGFFGIAIANHTVALLNNDKISITLSLILMVLSLLIVEKGNDLEKEEEGDD
jgi:hypothetical protein